MFMNGGHIVDDTNDEVDKENEDQVDEANGAEETKKPASLPSAIDQLTEELRLAKAKLAEANTKAEENWDLVLRAKAEADNVRRRARLDVEKAHKFGIDNFAKELLHVVDSLERGLEAISADNEDFNSIRHGMELTYKLFLDILEKFDINMMDPIGETFDPAKHEAISIQESDTNEPNSVIVVVQKGFTIHERVLRAAKVIVAKPSSPLPDLPQIDERA